MADSANWGGVVPTDSDVARFNASLYPNAPTASAALSLGQLLFDSGNTTGVTFGAGSSFLTLKAVLGVGIQINSGSGAVDTGGAAFKLDAAQSWINSSASDLTVGGNIDTNRSGLTVTGSGNTSFGGIVSDKGDLTKEGTGTLTLGGSAANTYTGLTTVKAGTLALAKSGVATAVSGALTIGSATDTAATVRYTGSSTDMLDDRKVVTINGRGVLDMNGATDTIGDVVIVATGAVAVNLTPLINTAGGGNLTIGTLELTPAADLTSRLHTGTGKLTLGGDVTFTAATTGRAQISGNLDLGAAARTFNVANGTSAGDDLTVDAVMTDGGVGFIKEGEGELALSGANAGSYTGNTEIKAGVVSFASQGLGDGAGTITLAGGSLKYAAGNAQDVGSRLRTSRANTLRVDVNGNAVIFSNPLTAANLAGTGGFTLTSTTAGGSLTLSGANTYGGLTTIGTASANSGTLKLATGASLKSGNDLTTLAGGTFDLNGNSQILGALVNDGTVTNTSSRSTFTLTSPTASSGAGSITGALDLVVSNNTGVSTTVIATANPDGTITNSGTGRGATTLTTVGPHVTAVTQSSTTSALTVTTLNVAAGGTTLTNTLGVQALTVTTAVTGTGDLILANNSALANGITLSGGANHTGKIINAGTGSGAETIAGVIGPNVTGLIQSSTTSVLILGAVNTFSGPVTVSAGSTLKTSVLGTFGNGDITVGTGATLQLGNAHSIADTANLKLELGGMLRLDYTGTETVRTLSSADGRYIGAGTYGAAALGQFFGTGYSFAMGGSLNVLLGPISAIPEPATYATLLGLGLLAFAVHRRRGRRAPLSIRHFIG